MIAVSINFFVWRKKNMYKAMKSLISKHYYKDGEAAKKKLSVFCAVERLTDDEYIELMALVETVYGAESGEDA